MKRIVTITIVLFTAFLAAGPALNVTAARPGDATGTANESIRPVHTYSIVARDSLTGELGVAVQSHWFSVGSVVTWAEAGVGAVATQSLVEVSYGPLGLEMMRAGKTAGQALEALLSADPDREVRQVAMVDAQGRVAVHTGNRCIAEAGHRAGDQFSVQANLMEKSTVWAAMARAYESTAGDLAERMISALEAAQKEGGDIRGKQSAAILIVKPESSGLPYRDKVMELRVEDHPEPVAELRRLAQVHRAYEYMNKGDELITVGDVKGAVEAYGKAARMLPDNPEVLFWAAITMITAGNDEEAMGFFKRVFAADEKWMEVVRRLPASGLLPDDKKLVEKILSAGQ